MQIDLTAEQQEFIGRAISTGRSQQVEDALREALALWVERERARDAILAAIDEAEPSFTGAEGIVITKDSMQELAEDVKRRGRARLVAEKKNSGIMAHRLAQRAGADLDEICIILRQKQRT